MMELVKCICRFVFEMGQQRRVHHSGWTLAMVATPDTVAEHSLRAAQIAYILACMEDYPNPSEAAAAMVFHDAHETRIGDLHKVARRYIDVDEERVAREQLAMLDKIGKAILELWLKVENKSPPLGHICKDADYLETAFTGKEYVERGFLEAQDWIDNTGKAMRTESGKKLYEMLRQTKSTEWWHGLKNLSNT